MSCLLVGSIATSTAAAAAAVGCFCYGFVIMLRACTRARINKCTRDHIFLLFVLLLVVVFFTIPTGTFESWATDFLRHFHKNIVVSAKYC